MLLTDYEATLQKIPLGGFHFFPKTGSTNDEALTWASNGAPDFSLVVADEQYHGRGREGRKWFSPAGAGLACSLILRPTAAEQTLIGRFSGLGALALTAALQKRGLNAQIKWPNDVLVQRKKLAGILVETTWQADQIMSLVLGLGVNVSPVSVPPQEILNFPATCVENEAGGEVSRFELLGEYLEELINLRAALPTESFLSKWQDALAFRGERVQLRLGASQILEAELLGLEMDGSLRVRSYNGEIRVFHFGEVHLRPN